MKTPDLDAVTDVARAERLSVALVEQRYRVAGRRSSPPAPQLDMAWVAVVDHLRGGELHGVALIAGGRSAGARVACRTAEAVGAAAVLCLAFPLVPPRRSAPAQSRLPERGGEVATLVVQGERDRFGMPPSGERREVMVIPGDHGLKKGLAGVTAAVREWLARAVR